MPALVVLLAQHSWDIVLVRQCNLGNSVVLPALVVLLAQHGWDIVLVRHG